MNIYDIDGNVAVLRSYKLAGAVLDATSETNRFLAMKQLFDIAKKKIANPSYTPTASEFSYAIKGAVCILPEDASMFENYPLDILYGKDETIQSIPASTTKVAALIAGFPYVTSIKEKVTLVSGDIQTGSGNYFSAGDILTIEDLMYGMMLPSSNTCAMAFAHYCGKKILGNDSATVSACVEAFVEEMNRKAALIGCINSEFDTPSGLSTTNKSTAQDMLRITIEACSYSEINRIWNKKSYTINIGGTNPRTQNLTTTVANSTLEASYYIFGGKTGHLTGSADALVMVAEPLPSLKSLFKKAKLKTTQIYNQIKNGL